MALFGVETGPEEAYRRALRAAGPAVVGQMGHGAAMSLTAVGDTVDTAVRLEQLTKTYEGDLVISEPVATRAGIDGTAYPRHDVTLRNRSRSVSCVTRAAWPPRSGPSPPPRTGSADGIRTLAGRFHGR